MRRKIFGLTAALGLLLLIPACSDLTGKADDKIDVKTDGKAYVRVAAGEARTVLPTEITTSDMSNITLKGKRNCGASEEILSADSFSELGTKTAEIAAGTWDFELSATINGATFTDSTSCTGKTVTAGETTSLSFTEMAASGTGSFSVTLNYAGTAAALTVKLDNTETTDFTNETNVLTLSRDSIDSGDHRLTVLFYGDSEKNILLYTFKQVIRVKAGRTSSAIFELNLNAKYTITYELNDGVVASDFPLVTSYAQPNDAIPLPPASKMTRENCTFGGWYETANFSGSAITEIAAGSTGDKTLYAKWTYSVTVDGAISGGTVVSDKTTGISSGSTVTLTVTAGFEKVMDTITVKDASNHTVTTTKVTAGKKYTFTMPESSATVTATFVNPYSTGLVGDIVFSDGKFITATNYVKYKDQLAQTAVAVIFDVNGGNKKGVGLRQSTRLVWAVRNTVGEYTKITTLVAAMDSGSNATDAVFSGAGATDGSGSLEKLKAAVSDYNATNYPAWAFVENYATTAGLTGTSYASGWYMPSIAELCKLYQAKGTVNNALNKITGAMKMDTGNTYWSSSQDVSNDFCVWDVFFATGNMRGGGGDCKYYDRPVCVVRVF